MALQFVLEAAVLLASVLTPSLRAISTVKIVNSISLKF